MDESGEYRHGSKAKKGFLKHPVKTGSFHVEIPLQIHRNLCSGKFKLNSTSKEVLLSQSCVLP